MRRSLIRFWLPVAIVALLVATAAAAWFRLPAIDSAVVVTTIKGEKISLPSLTGRVVLVNFWAPSCAPCVHEMPMLADTYSKLHGRGFDVIAVAANSDPPNIVVDYAETRHLPFAVALDIDDSVAKAFGGLRAVPSTFLIGRDGRIVWHVEGALDPDALRKVLERELGPG